MTFRLVIQVDINVNNSLLDVAGQGAQELNASKIVVREDTAANLELIIIEGNVLAVAKLIGFTKDELRLNGVLVLLIVCEEVCSLDELVILQIAATIDKNQFTLRCIDNVIQLVVF